MYTRAVWKEGEQEEEGVVPDNWIDRNNRTVRWPLMSATKIERALRDKINPQDDWMMYPLIKIKITSAKRCECNNYNLTSQAEEDDDDEPIRSTRKRTKKGIPEGFVRNELTDSDEESISDVKLANYPTPPRKLPPIQDTKMNHESGLNHASSEEAMSVQVGRADNSGLSTPYSGDLASSRLVMPSDRSQDSERTTPKNKTSKGLVEAFSTSEKRAAGSWCKEMSNLSGLVESANGFCGNTQPSKCKPSTSVQGSVNTQSSGGFSIRSRHSDGYRVRSQSRCSDGSRHTVRSRSRRSDGLRHTVRSRSRSRSRRSDGLRHTVRSRSRSRSRHSDGLRHTVRSRSRSRRSDGLRHTVRSRSRSRSRHSDGLRHTVRSRSRSRRSDGLRHTVRSRSRSRSRHSDGSRHTVRFRHDWSCHSDVSRPPYDRPRHDAVTETGRWTFPLPWDVYQKKVLNLLVDLRDQHKRAIPASSAVHIERMETMEDFEREEQRLCDAQAFDALVLRIARIGGKNIKDCVHKVLDSLFTNALMANFNMKGKGKKSKKPLERTKVYRAIQDGVMKCDGTATEDFIRMCTSEHLKHAPQRHGGHTAVSQDLES
ncbi:hypothetical protein AMEX_G18296 [Astyanax mexicanus]|uniref:DUF4806 domain-containing protein n=1 Tax=Astyanax mexicanus TaxID=7994 RepID=A0A8T2LDQ4_ASTMX|nr:hypothetical protein AMEX_G18296 [Astyanax mexicanus]